MYPNTKTLASVKCEIHTKNTIQNQYPKYTRKLFWWGDFVPLPSKDSLRNPPSSLANFPKPQLTKTYPKHYVNEKLTQTQKTQIDC